MEMENILNALYQFSFFLGVFGFFLLFAIFQGRQATMNVIVGLYLALLIHNYFPSYEKIFSGLASSQSIIIAKLGFFAFITLFTTALCYRIMPSEFREERFESLFKKILLAIAATITIIAFGFQLFSIGDLLSTSTPLQTLFGPEPYFFWWLLLPLVLLYIV